MINSKRRTAIAWTISILLNAAFILLLWLNPDFRRRVIEIFPRDEETTAKNEELRREIEKQITKRREQVKLDEQVTQQILERLEQEKTHRAVERVRELKKTYDEMVEKRENRLAEYREAQTNKPEREAVEALQTAIVDAALKAESLAARLEDNAAKEPEPETAGLLKEQAADLVETAAEIRQDAADMDGKPDAAHAADMAARAEQIQALAEAAEEGADDRITEARADVAAKAAEALAAAVEAAANVETLTAEEAGGEAIPELPPLSAETIEIAESSTADSMEDAWQAATEIESAVNQAYDETRAAELAILSNIEFAEASEQVIPTTNPERVNPFAKEEGREDGEGTDPATASGDKPAGLDAPPPGSLAEEMSRSTAAMNEAERQVSEMAQIAAQRLTMAESLSGAGRPPVDANALFAQQQIKEIAFSQSRFSDISGLMREASYGEGRSNDTSGGESGPRRADSAPMQRRDRLVDGGVANALPGRRFNAASSRTGWLYLDTWYVIGPWANQDITSFQPVHPPELEVNLDARYEGMVYTEDQAKWDQRLGVDRGFTPGRPRSLRWQFTQSDGARVIVPDERQSATYYAFTDVYFAEPQEMLVAIGTDDSGRVWINGLPVSEDRGLSPWAIDETVRKVFFKQGYNEILVRLENGPKDAELSFLICPPEALR